MRAARSRSCDEKRTQNLPATACVGRTFASNGAGLPGVTVNRSLDPRDVERIVRDVLVSSGAPFSLRRVVYQDNLWHVTVADDSGHTLDVNLPHAAPAALRRAVMALFDA